MKQRLIDLLKRSEKYTKTDMVYLASGTFWSAVNSILVTVLAFLLSVFFARYLTKEAYGTYQYILSIAGLIGATTLTGMNAAITRAVAKGFEGELKHSIKIQLKWGIVPFLLGLAVSLYYFINDNNALALAFAWISIFLPLQNSYNTWVAYAGGKKLFRIGTYYGLANNTLNYGASLLTIYLTQSFMWLVFVSFAFTFLNSFVMYQLLVRQIPPNDRRDPETINYGKHLSLMSIIGIFGAQIDSLLVFHFIGSAALAVYSFATLIPERIAGLIKYLPNIALPKLSGKTEAEVRNILLKKLWIFLLFLGAIAGIYALLAPWIFNTFFPTYTESIKFTQVYSLSFFSLGAYIVQTALTAQRKTKELYILNLVMPVVRAALMAGLMFKFGIWGLLWAQIIGNFASMAFQLIFLWKKPSAPVAPAEATEQTI